MHLNNYLIIVILFSKNSAESGTAILILGVNKMEMIINKFINENGKGMSSEKVKSLYKVYVFFLILILCMLPFAGGIISIAGMIISPLYCIIAYVYNRNLLKTTATFKNVIMAYSLFFGYLFLMFNLALYSFPRLLKLNLDVIVILIIIFEIICMIFGCCYTYISIKKNRIKKYKAESTLTNSIIALFCGLWTIFLRRYVSTTAIETQAFILLTSIAICCCVLTFYIGKIYIPMLYLIEKYNIINFHFMDE